MTIASEITKSQTNLSNCYTAVNAKGGTLPAAQNFDNLAACIGTISGGSSPVITSLNVTPTTSAQTITASSGTDGYSPVNIAAVTAAIDQNISAGNIKSGITILGVTGTATVLNGETRSVSLTNKNGQTFTPSSGKNGITSITVRPNNQARTVTPSTSSQSLTIKSGYSGNGTITVNAVTSSIDSNITAANIKKNVVILGVTGTYEGSGGGGNGIPREVSSQGKYCMPKSSFTFTLPDNATDIDAYALYYAFYNCTALTSVSFPGLTKITGSYALNYAFYGCTALTSISFPNLTTVTGTNATNSTFYGCTALTSVSFPSLTTLTNSNGMYRAFAGCTSLTSVSFPNLTTLGTNAFSYTCSDCTALTSISFPKLATISYGSVFQNGFSGCTALTSVSFPALTTTSFGSYATQFKDMLKNTGTTVTHTLHFPSNLSSKISALTGYPTFGGTSGYVTLAFDLTATS